MDWILNTICQYGTPQYLEYCSELTLMEQRLRDGLRLIPTDRVQNVPNPDIHTSNTVHEQSENEVIDHVEIQPNYFKLKFKQSVKSSGPKGTKRGSV